MNWANGKALTLIINSENTFTPFGLQKHNEPVTTQKKCHNTLGNCFRSIQDDFETLFRRNYAVKWDYKALIDRKNTRLQNYNQKINVKWSNYNYCNQVSQLCTKSGSIVPYQMSGSLHEVSLFESWFVRNIFVVRTEQISKRLFYVPVVCINKSWFCVCFECSWYMRTCCIEQLSKLSKTLVTQLLTVYQSWVMSFYLFISTTAC